MIRPALSAVAALGLAGCSQQPPEQQAQAATNVVVAAPPAAPDQRPPVPLPEAVTTPQPAPRAVAVVPAQTKPPEPPQPPTAFEYPADLGGKAVAKAVTPAMPAFTPTEKFAFVPKPRAVPARVIDPDPVSKATYVPPPVLSPRPGNVKPTAPPERVPVELGLGADVVPAKPTFPVAAGITERAQDVKVPPRLPILGRPPIDRVSLEDPTTEYGHAAIAAPRVKVAVGLSAFLKVTLPDPFELAAQVKPKVPPTAEPGLAPVVVDPQRVK